MSARRTERLLNLVICLLSTRRWLTKGQIRDAVPQYTDGESDEAFDRMFERDKEDLREMGIPVVTGSADAWFEDELGYRIDRDAYAVPDITFTTDELTVLGLASRVWQQASLGGPAASALVKLRAGGVEVDEQSLIGLEPRVRTSEPAFDPLYAAARDRAPVSFTYRAGRRSGSSGDLAVRHVEPWGLTSWRGRWYLVGHDRDRQAPRVFRLSRMDGAISRIGDAGSYQVPADLDTRALVSGIVGPEPEQRIAEVRVRHGAGHVLRRRAEDGGEVSREEVPGWDVLRVPFRDAEMLADELCGSGEDVVALEPADVVAAVVRRLQGVLVAHGESAPGDTAHGEEINHG